MDYKELFTKYQTLLKENKKLKAQLGIFDGEVVISAQIKETTSDTIINPNYDNKEKIKLFMSLFRGRDDVFAKRWKK